MKKTAIALVVLAVALAIWWALSFSASDYRLQPAQATFRNVTIATPDVRRLADFYQATFDAQEVARQDWVPAQVSGEAVVLRTPGYGGDGPTLTLIPARRAADPAPQASDDGYAHLCFETTDMRGVVGRLVAAGGAVSSVFEANERVPVLYARDPDGNAVEVHIPLPAPFTPRTVYRTLDSLVRTWLGSSAPAEEGVRFLHANHNSPDWTRVVGFYRAVFAAGTVGAERDYDGDFIAELTGIPDVAVRGRHIEMPGYSPGGPTLEAFTYDRATGRGPLGFGDAGVVAIGFEVHDIAATVALATEAGGGEVERSDRAAIVRDPYGHLIQLRQVQPPGTL
ncbi:MULTISPECIES: VOC family protein [unclassified Pseudomonas]|uniref:VOC family protein n=1 Tax=unclassified Pseudomonas TaxID=196821 RepID=UPI00244A101D|nr:MULTISPECIES: VOC family protein [unclassified Pseudomonas]MDG9926989.1 VOC family protein [Pseudomonas sp. GD04042]MDH0485900.1 VOC family protein [Pseudomonas sp. GD04015]MDH0602404.1 VOC family protein [Pseudomonas sp. GD03869]